MKTKGSDKTIFSPLDRLLPSIRYTGTAELPPGGNYRNSHVAVEICYIESGRGEFQQGRKACFKFKSGDVLLIKPKKRFIIQADADEEVTSCFLGINPGKRGKKGHGRTAEEDQIAVIERIFMQCRLQVFKDRLNIGLLLKRIFRSVCEKKTGYLLLAKGCCLECLSILAELIRGLESKRGDNPSARNYKTVEKVIGFIEENYQKKLSLKDMASNAFLSPYHFSRIFKLCTSHPPMRYLNMYRIGKAKELLADENLSSADIAELVGFNDPYYFSAIFKKLEGISPSRYKKLLR